MTFEAWLQERHPATWRQYLHFFSMSQETANLLSTHSRSFRKKSLSKYRQYQIACGSPASIPRPGDQQLRHFVRANLYGSLKKRQQATILLLYLDSILSGAAICCLTLNDDNGELRATRLSAEASTALDRWKALRERLRSNEAERRRQRISQEWAQSPYLFPSPTGGPSRFSPIKKAGLSSASS